MAFKINSKIKTRRKVYCVVFFLLIALKISPIVLSVNKQQQKAVATQSDGENEKSIERCISFEKEIAYQSALSNVMLVQTSLIAHFTVYKKTYIPLHHQAVKLQPPELLFVG